MFQDGLTKMKKVISNRVVQHVVFWSIVFVLYTFLYSVKSSFWIAFRNNLFYTPLHISFYYIITGYLIPRYLFEGRYVSFLSLLVFIMLVLSLISRIMDIYIAIPYIIKYMPLDSWEKAELVRSAVFDRLFDLVFFMNALKAMNMIVWFAVVIKMFKLWYERKQAALQAELNALKGQVHPHFLFNTLNNLYALTLVNSPRSSEVVLGLSDLLRYMLYECDTDLVNLQKEVQMLQRYIALERLRYEERLDLNFTISGRLDDKLVTPLIMLTFIENAFKHGASDTVGEAWVTIDLQVMGDNMKLKVANSKPASKTPNAGKHFGNIGLQNARKRLELLYPAAHELKIMDDEDTFLVVLELKLQTDPTPAPDLALTTT